MVRKKLVAVWLGLVLLLLCGVMCQTDKVARMVANGGPGATTAEPPEPINEVAVKVPGLGDDYFLACLYWEYKEAARGTRVVCEAGYPDAQRWLRRADQIDKPAEQVHAEYTRITGRDSVPYMGPLTRPIAPEVNPVRIKYPIPKAE